MVSPTPCTSSTDHTPCADAVTMVSDWQTVMLSSHPQLQLHNNMYYHGNPSYPQVGDVRVSFEFAGNTQPGQEDQVREWAG